jgi:transposase-like protein
MVFELRAASGSSRGTLASVGQKLGVNPETLRNWVEKAEIDSGQRFTLTPADEPPQHESGNRSAAASIDSHAPTRGSAAQVPTVGRHNASRSSDHDEL